MVITEKKQRGGRQWKPGESGNPHGRPKTGFSITEVMRAMLNGDQELRWKIAEGIAKKAKEGDPAACKLLMSYMDGLPAQNINLGNQKDENGDSEPFELIVVNSSRKD